jgi:hypothetical protein
MSVQAISVQAISVQAMSVDAMAAAPTKLSPPAAELSGATSDGALVSGFGFADVVAGATSASAAAQRTASATDVRCFAVTIISTLPFRALSGAGRSCP